MKKQKMQMAILLGILVIFVAGFFAVKQYNKVQSGIPEEDTSIVAADMNPEDILQFSYDYEGESYSFEREGETWYAAGDRSMKLVQSSISTMLSGFSPLTAGAVIYDVTDMSQYGLTSPGRTIAAQTASESLILYVGDYNSVSGGYYICKPSETTVYLVPDSFVNLFNKTLEDLKETEETVSGS